MSRLLRNTVFVLLLTCHPAIVRSEPLSAKGVLPDEPTTLRVAEILFASAYGVEEMEKFKPYHATFHNGEWTVYGALPANRKGGALMMKIKKRDAQVIEMWHSL